MPSIEEEPLPRPGPLSATDLRGDRMRARHRLGKLLLRQGLRYPGPGADWTQRHHEWLAKLHFS